jgi:hypothetical protein
MIILFGTVFVLLLHLFRRKIDLTMAMAMIPSAILSFLSVLIFYDFSPIEYIEQTSNLALTLFEDIGQLIPGIIFAATGFAAAVVLSRRLKQQEYRSLFHVVYGLLLIYFMIVNADVCSIFIGICMVLFFIGEYLRLTARDSPIGRIAGRLLDAASRDTEMGYMATLFFLILIYTQLLFTSST